MRTQSGAATYRKSIQPEVFLAPGWRLLGPRHAGTPPPNKAHPLAAPSPVDRPARRVRSRRRPTGGSWRHRSSRRGCTGDPPSADTVGDRRRQTCIGSGRSTPLAQFVGLRPERSRVALLAETVWGVRLRLRITRHDVIRSCWSASSPCFGWSTSLGSSQRRSARR